MAQARLVRGTGSQLLYGIGVWVVLEFGDGQDRQAHAGSIPHRAQAESLDHWG